MFWLTYYWDDSRDPHHHLSPLKSTSEHRLAPESSTVIYSDNMFLFLYPSIKFTFQLSDNTFNNKSNRIQHDIPAEEQETATRYQP